MEQLRRRNSASNTKKRCTIYDVAAKANVAPSTVSHILNGTAPISAETRERVEQVIKELDYRPNANARTLRQSHSRILGVILQDISSEYYAQCASTMLQCAQQDNYVVLTSDIHFTPSILENTVTTLIERRVDGLIFIGGANDEKSILNARKIGVPVVIGDRYVKGFPCVEFNNFETVRNLVISLYEEGFRRFAYVGELENTQQNLQRRYEGFVDGLNACGIPKEHRSIILDERMHFIKWKSSYEIFVSFLKETPVERRPQVVITSNDMIAQGIIGACARSGLRIPEDIAVTGFDNINMSAYVTPSITSIAQDPGQLGIKCFELMKALIEGKFNTVNVMLEQQIVVRESAPISMTTLHKNGMCVLEEENILYKFRGLI